MSIEDPPTKVIEVRSDNYLSRPIHYRDDSMLLYGPVSTNDKKNAKDKYYEIVLHKPFTESLNHMYRYNYFISRLYLIIPIDYVLVIVFNLSSVYYVLRVLKNVRKVLLSSKREFLFM